MTQSSFDSAVASVLSAFYGAYGIAATWVSGGTSVAVTLMENSRAVRSESEQHGYVRVTTLECSVRVADVATPLKGDLITIDGETTTFKVTADPMLTDGVEWDLVCEHRDTIQHGGVQSVPMR